MTVNTFQRQGRLFKHPHGHQPPRPYLWSKARYVEEVNVAQVGQTDQCVFAVIFLSYGVEGHQGHLPHPTAFVRSQLELGLGAHLWERKHLERQQREKTGVKAESWSPTLEIMQ